MHRCMPCVKQVANKVIELVMMQSGCDVCCTSEADRERMERVALKIDAEVLSETEGTQQLSKAQR